MYTKIGLLKARKFTSCSFFFCNQERDIAVEDSGGVKMYTRSELRDQGRGWASSGSNRRAAEYDVI